MTDIPDTHPRAASLRLRDALVQSVRDGITSEAGLIAHGRGEAFYYLLGERTHDFARTAIRAAAAQVLRAKHPVFSVNGNVAGLAAHQIVELVNENPRLWAEVNLFHFSLERVKRIVAKLQQFGVQRVLGSGLGETQILPGLDHARRLMDARGIAIADVVLVPLEDGDRCQALVASGRKVITIDLNPLSRTAQSAHITIVDELTHALPLLREELNHLRNTSDRELDDILSRFNNKQCLQAAMDAIRKG